MYFLLPHLPMTHLDRAGIVARRYHGCSNTGWMLVSRDYARRVQSSGGRLGDVQSYTGGLVVNALNMGVLPEKPNGVIHHSDHGSQYTSIAFTKRCEQLVITMSIGSVGDCDDTRCVKASMPHCSASSSSTIAFAIITKRNLAISTSSRGFTPLGADTARSAPISPIAFERRYAAMAARCPSYTVRESGPRSAVCVALKAEPVIRGCAEDVSESVRKVI